MVLGKRKDGTITRMQNVGLKAKKLVQNKFQEERLHTNNM